MRILRGYGREKKAHCSKYKEKTFSLFCWKNVIQHTPPLIFFFHNFVQRSPHIRSLLAKYKASLKKNRRELTLKKISYQTHTGKLKNLESLSEFYDDSFGMVVRFFFSNPPLKST